MTTEAVWPDVARYLQIKLTLFDLFAELYPILFVAYVVLFFKSIRWRSWNNVLWTALFLVAVCLWTNLFGLTDWLV